MILKVMGKVLGKFFEKPAWDKVFLKKLHLEIIIKI